MSIAPLSAFKDYLRELTDDLDDPMQMALDAAIAEASGFTGFDLVEAYDDSNGAPSDVVMAVFLLAQTYVDGIGVNESNHCRAIAQKLLTRYRVDPGFVGVGAGDEE